MAIVRGSSKSEAGKGLFWLVGGGGSGRGWLVFGLSLEGVGL